MADSTFLATIAAGVMTVLAVVALMLRALPRAGADQWYPLPLTAAIGLWLGVLASRTAPVVIDHLGEIFLGAMVLNLGLVLANAVGASKARTRGEGYRPHALVWAAFGVVCVVLVLRFLDLRVL